MLKKILRKVAKIIEMSVQLVEQRSIKAKKNNSNCKKKGIEII